MRKINPQIKVILVSGHSLEGEAQQILDEGAVSFLQKLFIETELTKKIASFLHQL
jgi:CheY-like chemotaxis protein